VNAHQPGAEVAKRQLQIEAGRRKIAKAFVDLVAIGVHVPAARAMAKPATGSVRHTILIANETRSR
jgi:hypothetical protein